MNLSKLAVDRPVTIAMFMLVVVLLGVISLSRLPIDLLPEIEVPVAIVSTSYSGVGPQEMENLITKPLEGAVATVSNIESINSISSQGVSIVIAQFKFGTDMDFAALEMREKVDLIKGALPQDASEPMVLKIDPNATPILQLSLTNGGDLASLQVIAEDTIAPRLERLDGVASVNISGGYTNQIQVKVNQLKLESYGLSIGQLAQLVGASNLNLPGGTVTRGEQELTIRTMGEFTSIQEIQEMPITLPTGGIIKLSDLAEVEMAPKDIDSISRVNGKNSINISIQKQSGTNTVQVANIINKEIEKLQQEFTDIEFNTILDQSVFINQSISNVFKNAIVGAVLAIAILYLFLRNIRTTLIIGTSIPISIVATFILLYFSDITLNLMTLGGLALGVGMLVDNAIVVLENIYRLRTEGYSRKEAAIAGASEVSMAVTASTLTTIAVFVPIVFVGGLVSTIFRELAMTVTLSLVASLVVALTLIPMLSSKILKVTHADGKRKEGKENKLDAVYNAFDRTFKSVEERYKKILKWSLTHRKKTVFLSILIFIGSMSTIFFVGAEFFPATDEGQVNINVSLPVGSGLEETNKVLLEIEELFSNIEEADVVFSSVGSGGMMGTGGGDQGSVTLSLVPLAERSRSSKEISDEIRSLVKDIPGAEIKIGESSMMMMGLGGDPISISIKGDDLEKLEEISQDFKKIVEEVEGTREVTTSLSEGTPELQVTIDKYNAATYGLTTAQVANAIRNAASGVTATRYKYEGNEIDVVIKGEELVTESLSNLEQVGIPTATGGVIPLKEIANLSVERGPVQINREGQQRVVTVSGQISDRDLRSVTEDIEVSLKNYYLPQGYSYELGGQNKELNDAFTDLSMALLLAVILIYMVMAAQFESLIHPFTIILSVPLAFSGGLLGLFITRRSMSVPALIGVIILAGVVVNNAIVLVDYINTLRKNGKDRDEAVVIAGPVRLRPILMTTLTTVLGLVPLALGIGEGAEVQAPMATVVIGGLTLSTLLTLVLIPVVYTLIDDFSYKVKTKLAGIKKVATGNK